MNNCHKPISIGRSAGRERGVVLVFALIALLIMMIGAVALVRSFNTSLMNTGSLAFKKDLVHRNEAAMARVIAVARNPSYLAGGTSANSVYQTLNYSPLILPQSNHQGIPDLLLMSDADFDASPVAQVSNDIVIAEDQMTLRYVIDRQCDRDGPPSADNCVTGITPVPGGSADTPIRAENASSGGSGALTVVPVYRLSVRVMGPKGALAFYQTTFTL
jgi:type IV pilus assembly protein PilX